MKDILTILLNSILITVTGFGQHYEPFIRESKQWRYVQALYLTDNGINYYVETDYFKGDTIINDIRYNKFYSKQDQPFSEIEALSYYFREDTIDKKVYVYDFHFNKTALLYDFNLKKGDIFNIYIFDDLYSKHTVLDVDTIITANKKLKRIVFDDSTTWIEGLGCISKTYIPSEGELICIKEDDSVLYINSKYNNCDTVFKQDPYNGIKVINHDNLYNFSVFPNPVVYGSVLTVKAIKNEEFKIEIFSNTGVLVKEDNFIDNYPIGLINLNKGLYIYRLINNNMIIGIDKITVK